MGYRGTQYSFISVLLALMAISFVIAEDPKSIRPQTKYQHRLNGDKSRHDRAPSHTIKTPTITSSIVKDVKDVQRVPVTKSLNDPYVNMNLDIGESHLTLRVDLQQDNIWVMEESNYYSCNKVESWYSSEALKYHTSFASSFYTHSDYLDRVCASGGLYSAQATEHPSEVDGITNGEEFAVPYLNAITAEGVFATDNLTIDSEEGGVLTLDDFTFVSVDNSSSFYGGVGLASGPQGSGLLSTLKERGFIDSTGYSMWFNSSTAYEEVMSGEIVLGAVDKSHFQGDFYQFDMLNYTEDFFQSRPEVQRAFSGLRLPIVQVDSMTLRNHDDGESSSLSQGDSPFPALLDTRFAFTVLPLETIIALAIQTNAFYSKDLFSWIVQCDIMNSTRSTIDFTINDLTIEVPLKSFIFPLSIGGYENISFANGGQACYLALTPNSNVGFNVLGIQFVSSAYIAVDNEGGKIALGKPNRNTTTVYEDKSSYTVSAPESRNFSSTIDDSIAYIQSGSIPFATVVTPSNVVTMSFSSITNYSDPKYPSRFSGHISGHTIFSQIPQVTSSRTHKSKSPANKIKVFSTLDGERSLPVNILVVSGTFLLFVMLL